MNKIYSNEIISWEDIGLISLWSDVLGYIRTGILNIRPATQDDINSILMLRYKATENRLRNTITYEMIASSLQKSCKAWVADDEGVVVGFSLANKKQKCLWGLFVLSSYQGKGVGEQLLQRAVSWLTCEARDYLIFKPKKIWLDTELGGRAESFYQHMGWERGEFRPDGEVRYWYLL
tara:strand:+ start:51577 stop:52107 length:531 start_codon:yes stop_codon:yes gene_type:complete